MAMVTDEAAAEYVASLHTTEQRRAAASVSRSELLTAVRALAGCQRCSFVEQVLGAFDREPSAATQGGPPVRLGASDLPSAVSAPSYPTGGRHSLHSSRVMILDASQPSASAVDSPASGRAAGAAATHQMVGVPSVASAGVMAPAQILALLSSTGGPSDLVGLMQFAWKDMAAVGGSDADGRDGDCLTLSGSLLSRPRLLRRFLVESVGVMQALAEEVGDCRRHTGYPGPWELASTLTRLDSQRYHTIQRLAAWGVLRSTSPPVLLPPATSHAATQPLPAADLLQGVGDVAAGSGAGAAMAVSSADGDDPQLALAVQLSLRDPGSPTSTSPPAASPPRPPLSPSPVGDCSLSSLAQQVSWQQQQKGSRSVPRIRPQRTPPRPTGGSSPASAVLGTDGGPGGGPGSTSSLLRDRPCWSGPSRPHAAEPPGRRPGAAAGPSPSRLHSLHSPGATAAGRDGTVRSIGAADVLLTEAAPAEDQRQDPSASTAPVAAAPDLPRSVAAAVAAAASLADATVLVDSEAVAALSEGLRERVQHLVTQLVQVQQRRTRLEHACQHGILAAGRKLLLILLQLLWASLRRAAAAAAAEAAAAAARELTAAAAVAVGGTGGTPGIPGAAAAAVAAAAAAERGSTEVSRRQEAELPPATGAGVSAGASGAAEQSPSPQPQPQPQAEVRRVNMPRYEGLLADLAAGLGEDDTFLDLILNSDLDLDEGAALDRGADRAMDLEGGQSRDGSGAVGGAGGGGGGGLGGAVNAVVWGVTRPGQIDGDECDGSGRAREAALAVGRGTGNGRPHPAWLSGNAPPPARSSVLLPPDGDTSCLPGCAAAREQQRGAEQLRILQGQLHRCQACQSQLEGEVGRLLDMLAEQRRVQEQATAALRRELAQWRAEPGALLGMGAEELAELAARLEAALGRVRAAQVQMQAAVERDLLCPVCWERRKGVVFGCGHQTCCSCGEKLATCPICRESISLRIRVYN